MPLSRQLLDRLQSLLFAKIAEAAATAVKANPVPELFYVWTDLGKQTLEDVGWELQYTHPSAWRSSGNHAPTTCWDRLIRGIRDKDLAGDVIREAMECLEAGHMYIVIT
jgi:hypothetical protein